MNSDMDSLHRKQIEDRVAETMARTDIALALIRREVVRAVTKFPAFHSAHEGYAVAQEEMDELWHEIKQQRQNYGRQHVEATHCAAMFVRFLTDVTMPEMGDLK